MNILGNNRHRIRRDDIVYSGSYSGYFTGGLDYNFNLNTPINGFYLQTPYTSDLDLSTGDIVIEARFNATSFSHVMAILAKDTYGLNFDWGLLIENSTTLRFTTAMTSQNLYATVPTMNIGQWYHFKFERISGVNTIYLDGVAYGSNTISITNMSTISLTVGSTSYNNPGYHFEGYVDNIHVSKNGIDVINLDFETLNSNDQFVDNTGRLWTIHPEPYVNLIPECLDIVRDGLIVFYDMVNINSYDRIGSVVNNLQPYPSANGNLYNNPTFTNDGGLSFNGTNQALIYSNDFTAAFTVITFAKSNTSTWNENGTLGSYRGANGYILHGNQGTSLVNLRVNSSIDTYTGGIQVSNIPVTNILLPHMYAVSSNGTSAKAYVDDNEFIIPGTISPARNTSTGLVYLGEDSPNYNYRYGNVTIYIHMYYNRQLSYAEMKQNYKVISTYF